MTQATDPREVAEVFDAEVRVDEPFEPSWNVAPTDPVTVVLQRDDGRSVERHRWGLIPSWAKRASEGARMINARAESLAESPAFRVAFGKRRCIVPADGFYEWRRSGRQRVAFYLRPPEDGVLALAGLWSVWKDPATGLWVPSAAVVTTDANAAVAGIHDRMPVLLPRDAWADWLDPAQDDLDWLRSLLVPAPDDVLAIDPVSAAVNDVRNDGPELIAPVVAADELAQPTLFG
jgi:putative SOS response-associated peptidase YedK